MVALSLIGMSNAYGKSFDHVIDAHQQ